MTIGKDARDPAFQALHSIMLFVFIYSTLDSALDVRYFTCHVLNLQRT